MTSVVAAIVALGAGSVVAAFLYFKRSAKFPWDLALLRLVWTGLLVYALCAPPVSTEREQSFEACTYHCARFFKVFGCIRR